MTNQLQRPMPFEVITGWNGTRRVRQTMSRAEALAEYERLQREGKAAEVWLGELRVRGRARV